jgi:hypothetical protein
MAKIYVLGTSNSITGINGYVEALRLSHDVINRSSGRNSSFYHISHILENRVEIEACDYLIIDHYVNDANFYFSKMSDHYADYLEMLYQLLATLNVSILNLMFPLLSHRHPEVRELVLKEAEKHQVTTLDLNDWSFGASLFIDHVHIDRYISYMMGLSLAQSLDEHANIRPAGGGLAQFPLRLITAAEIAPDIPLHHYENSVSKFDYIILDRSIELALAPSESVISIGYYRSRDETQDQGFFINGISYGVNSKHRGYFQEVIPKPEHDVRNRSRKNKVAIAPMLGQHDGVVIMSRNKHFSGDFINPGFINILTHTPSITFSGNFAVREFFEVPMLGFENSLLKVQSFLTQNAKEKSPARPSVSAATINYLRDTAISLDKPQATLAIDLLEIASLLRPKGKFILKRLESLRKARKNSSP